jgi:hypothetical protein
MSEKPKHDEVLHDTRTTFTQTLNEAARQISQRETVTVRDILELVGEQGLLILCMILMLPFLLPVSVPGVSTIFSLVVMLVGFSVTTNWLWLPDRIMNRKIDSQTLVNSMQKGANIFSRLDGLVRPRLLRLSDNRFINRLNGMALIFGGILLIFPLGLVPFSNTLPGIAVLLLAAGMLQRDGLFIIGGYVANIISVIYFGGLFLAALAAGQSISSLLGS